MRARAKLTGKRLASIEAIGEYALQHRNLYRTQDGVDLPFFDCAGLEQGEGFGLVSYFEWIEGFAYPAQSGFVLFKKSFKQCASPSLVG